MAGGKAGNGVSIVRNAGPSPTRAGDADVFHHGETPAALSAGRSPLPLLQAESLRYRAGRAVLVDGVSLDLPSGEVLALVGPNGAGKSTLLRMLAGELAPAAGQVRLDGQPLSAFAPAELALRRAVMPQQTLLQFAFTAREVVAMGRAPHLRAGRGDRRTDEAVIDAALARTDAAHLAARTYPSLSGGEQQRITLARVLAQETPLLLLDEPTASLDIRHQELVMQIARETAAAGGAVLAVLHDLNLAAASATRIAVLRAGRLAAIGPPREVLRAELLSEVFEHPLLVTDHPLRDCPLIVPG